jgi:GLPGLI family protein
LIRQKNIKNRQDSYKITIMKKHLLLPACLLALVFSVRAQKPDTASIIVHYKFSYLPDTNNLKNIYQENMMLLLGKKSTAYKSYDARLADLDAIRQIQEQMAANGGHGNFRVDRRYAGSSTEYYLFPGENKLIRKEKLINSYLVAEPLPVIAWQITSATTSFGSLHCQKATAHFKGRNYTAWFCPDIPSHGGPWKLSGLPGLIVEAYDTKKQVVFKFDGIDDISKMAGSIKLTANKPQPPGGLKFFGLDDIDMDPRLIILPANAIKTTEPQLAKLKKAMHVDPNAFLQSAMAGPGGMSPNGPQMHADKKMGAQPVENNPIELPEK